MASGIALGIIIAYVVGSESIVSNAAINPSELIMIILLGYLIRSFIFNAVNKSILNFSFNFSCKKIKEIYYFISMQPVTTNINGSAFLKNITHEVLNFQANALTPILLILADSVSILLLFLTAIFFSAGQTLAVFLCFCIFGCIWNLFSKKIRHLAKLRSEAETRKLQIATTLVNSRNISKGLDLSAELNCEFERCLSKSAGAGADHQALNVIPKIVIELMVVWALGYSYISGVTISETQLISLALILRCIPNILRVFTNLGNLKSGMHAYELITNYQLNIDQTVREKMIIKAEKSGDIIVKPISNNYRNEIRVTNNLSVVTGRSGSGKTVFFKSFIDALTDEGFDGCYFDVESVNDENLIAKLMKIDASKLTVEMEKEFDTIASTWKKHNKISLGQAERLMLLHVALIPQHIVILDELFIHIEEDKKLQYLDFISLHRKGKTTIIITHDRFTLEYCKSVIKLHD